MKDGLSQNSVTAILQDSKGFMWFGTHDGLNKYDGTGFKSYRQERNNPNSISNNYIWDLYEDADGLLWIATFGGGLNSLDLKAGTIERFSYQPNEPNSFPSNRIFSIQEGENGILWIGANEGLIRFDKQTKTSELFLSTTSPQGVLQDNYTGIVAADKNGNLWLRNDNGLTLFNTQTLEPTYFTQSPFSKEHILGDIYDIKWHNNKLLVGCDTGLLEIDLVNKTDRFLLLSSDVSSENSSVTFRKIHLVNDHQFYIGTHSGLVFFDAENNSHYLYEHSKEDDKSLVHNHVLSLRQSKDGVVWIGSRNGIDKIEAPEPDFIHFRNFTFPNAINVKNINSIIETKNNLLCIGSTSGLNLYDKNNDAFVDISDIRSQMTSDYLLHISKDSKENIWIGTRTGGFYQIDPQFHIKKIAPENKDASNARVHFITEDHQGFIWLGTGGEGLWRYDPRTNRVKMYPVFKDGKGPSHPYVFTILEDQFKNLWLGTPTGGLNLFDRENEAFIYFQNHPDNTNSLANDLVLSLTEDSNNQLWIGTTGGLSKLTIPLQKNLFSKLKALQNQAADSLFVNFGRPEGFPNEVIYGILEDHQQNLWMSTNQGLVQFDTQTESIVNIYEAAHGLQSNEFNQNSYHKGDSGLMYFGGIDGFNIFNPKTIKGNTYIPEVRITGLSILNQPVVVGQAEKNKKPVLDKEPYFKESITLSWKEKVVSFHFAALSYISPEKNSYQYKMEGFDEDWVFAGNTNQTTYTNLDPGTYTFRVNAANNSGVWNETGTAIIVHVNPPPWRSWYAYVAYLLLFLAAIYAFIKYRVNKATQALLRKAEIERVRNEERETFRKRSSQDFHDEAGNKITRISLVTALAKQEADTNDQLKNYLNKIEENVQELNTGMRDFIWALDPGKDTLYETLHRFEDFASGFCEDAQVHFKSDGIDEYLNHFPLNMNQRRHLLLILKETLHNSIKHAAPKNIHLKIAAQKEEAIISLSDDGKGFELNTLKRQNGLQNIKERAKQLNADLEIQSAKNNGTKVAITLKNASHL
ncbi:ligand-binding sensor domain-containing protein [Yeosuana sp. AK3]